MDTLELKEGPVLEKVDGRLGRKASTALDPEEALQIVKEVHSGKNFDWSKFKYVRARDKVEVGCPVHGTFSIVYDSLKSGRGCRHCGYLTTRSSKAYTTEIFVGKVKDELKDVNGDPYDYTDTVYIDRSTPVPVRCLVHGEFLMHPGNAMHNGSGCPKCGMVIAHDKFRKSIEQVETEIYNILDPEKYRIKDISQYTSNKDYLTMTCLEHGDWNTKLNWLLVRGNGCPRCSVQGTSLQELEVFDFVRDDLGFEDAIRGSRSIIPPEEVDIYIPSLKIGIEFDGLYYHSEAMGKTADYHISKTEKCAQKGIRLIHMWEDEWSLMQDKVKSRISHILGVGKDKPLYARNLIPNRVNYKNSQEFFNTHHLQGSVPNQNVAYGLYNEGELVACMGFGKLRFGEEDNKSMEIYRYASKGSVTGGFSRLVSEFKRDHPDINSLYSYSDKRWSDGGVYRKNGFSFVSTSKPSYDYTSSSARRWTRQTFMKDKMPTLLEKGIFKSFDPELTEVENCKANGFWRVWNCGMDKWKLTLNKDVV